MKSSRLIFSEKLPTHLKKMSLDLAQTLVIYDERLTQVSSSFAKWVQLFAHTYPVASGEPLKALEAFPGHVSRLTELAAALSPREMTVLAVGGGSVGDFAGFFASVFKRGVRLVHMPSTWLAAIDSSHGGKTALNTARAKNQIGTFYPASSVILVRELLQAQPRERVLDALGELAKIAMIDGGPWVKKLEKTVTNSADGNHVLWTFLRPAVEAKLKVVRRDPREEKGHRQILNLGHTVGHVFEIAFGWSHGFAVAQGLWFALELGRTKKRLATKDFARATALLNHAGLAKAARQTLSAEEFQRILNLDKKKTSAADVTFIFLRRFGKTSRERVKTADILHEARRQGWIDEASR